MDRRGQVWNRYLCRGCGVMFNDKTGTLLHYSRLSLQQLVLLSFYLGLPFMRPSNSLGIGYKMFRRMLSAVSRSGDGSRLSGVVELDEMFITAGLKGRGYR